MSVVSPKTECHLPIVSVLSCRALLFFVLSFFFFLFFPPLPFVSRQPLLDNSSANERVIENDRKGGRDDKKKKKKKRKEKKRRKENTILSARGRRSSIVSSVSEPPKAIIYQPEARPSRASRATDAYDRLYSNFYESLCTSHSATVVPSRAEQPVGDAIDGWPISPRRRNFQPLFRALVT